MTARPDPFSFGLLVTTSNDGFEVSAVPPVVIPAWLAAELEPMLVRWVTEHHERGAQRKLASAAPYVRRWQYLAELSRSTFPRESDMRPGGDVAAPSSHEITTTEAAGILGCSRQWVGQLCAAGELESRKVGGRLLVDAASVERFAEVYDR